MIKATVKKDLAHMFDDGELNEGDELTVEHYAYGIFYKIVEPAEWRGTTVTKDYIDIVEGE